MNNNQEPPTYNEYAQKILNGYIDDEQIPIPEDIIGQQFQTKSGLEIKRDEMSNAELQQIFDDIQEVENKDIRNLTLKVFFSKLLNSLFYFLDDILNNNETIIQAIIKEDRSLYLGINLLLFIIFIKTFILL